MSSTDISTNNAKDFDLKAIILGKLATSDESKLKSRLTKLKKEYALLMATAETMQEDLQEKFIENCTEKNFSLDVLINIKDEMDLIERKKKVANEIYLQLIGKE